MAPLRPTPVPTPVQAGTQARTLSSDDTPRKKGPRWQFRFGRGPPWLLHRGSAGGEQVYLFPWWHPKTWCQPGLSQGGIIVHGGPRLNGVLLASFFLRFSNWCRVILVSICQRSLPKLNNRLPVAPLITILTCI